MDIDAVPSARLERETVRSLSQRSDALVQRAEEESENAAMQQQRRDEPRLPATRPHEQARRCEEPEMGAELECAARIRAARQGSDRLTRQKRNR